MRIRSTTARRSMTAGMTAGMSAGLLAALAGQASGQLTGPFPAEFELSSLAAGDGTFGFVLNGIDASDYSGRSVSSAGDVNGDGIDDFIIGASGADPNGNFRAGESYVVFGGPGVSGTGTIELSSLKWCQTASS